MVDIATVRRLCLALPEARETSALGRLSFSVGAKRFVWSYLARKPGVSKARDFRSRGPRIVQPGVLAVRCPIERKEMLIEADPGVFFDDDHYRGYPAVLVRLAAIDESVFAILLEGAWTLQAPKKLVRASRMTLEQGKQTRPTRPAGG